MPEKTALQKRQENFLKIEYTTKPKFPNTNLLIELSNICNDECIFCANRKMKRKKGYMDFGLLTSILNQAYDNGCHEVGFYATGEPLVYPKLSEAVKLAKDIGYTYTYITTNGALLTEEKMISLFDAGLDSIKFSINAYDRDTYKLIHGRDDFDKVINNLKMVSEYRKKNNLKFRLFISFVITKFTQDKTDYFKAEYSKYCDEILFVEVLNQAGLNSEIHPLLTCDHKDKNIVCGTQNIPCARIFNGISITYEGYLSACCVDFENQLIIADLNKVPLAEAWVCEKYQKLRQAHLDKKVKGTMCQNCFNYSKRSFEPLSPEYATPIDFDTMYSQNDIEKRIALYESTKDKSLCVK